VDGRERLRRYLEQRRDAGERELLLDSMTVDEVMRIVAGLPQGAGAPAVGEAPVQNPPLPPAAPVAGLLPAVPVEQKASDDADWRSILASAVGDVAVPRPVEPLADTTRPSPRSSAPASPTAPSGAAFPGVRSQGMEGAGSLSAPGLPTGEIAPPSDQPWPAGLVFGRPGVDLFGGPLASLRTLEDVARAVASCTACSLYGTAKNPVPGEGSPTASLVCVGEAPGATEDETGRPFVGAAGKLLDKILAAIDLTRENVFICNVLKHRPPGNRNPLPGEVAACTPFLVRQLELIRPRVILALGSFAAQTLLETTQPIGKLRGAVHRYYGVPLIATYHPAALLRNPAWKRPTWEDVQYARRILDGTGV
jgi:uracil-DNA glycosylase family 4